VLFQASLDVTGGFDHCHPVLESVRSRIDDTHADRVNSHRLTNFNNHPEAAHEDVLTAR